jgi:hypothetical protein
MRSRTITRALSLAVAALAALALLAPAGAAAAPRSNAELVAAHARTIAECDVGAIVDTYAADATLIFPGGQVVKGRAALTQAYGGLVKAPAEGGLCGLKTVPVREWRHGDTSFVKFKDVAPFLAKPYYSTDAYVFEDGEIAVEATTFDPTKLVFKKS